MTDSTLNSALLRRLAERFGRSIEDVEEFILERAAIREYLGEMTAELALSEAIRDANSMGTVK